MLLQCASGKCCIPYRSITRGSKVRVSEGETFTHPALAGMRGRPPFPPRGLKFHLAPFYHHFHQWIIPRRGHPSALRVLMLGLTDSVDLLMWMVSFFEVLFPFKCQNLQDHVLGSTPFLPLSQDLSCSGDNLQSWLSFTPDIFPCLSSVESVAQNTGRANLLEPARYLTTGALVWFAHP